MAPRQCGQQLAWTDNNENIEAKVEFSQISQRSSDTESVSRP